MTVSVTTPPRQTRLTTPAHAAEVLQVTETDLLATLVQEAGDMIRHRIGWGLVRQQLTETFRGSMHRQEQILYHPPIAQLVSIAWSTSSYTVGTDVIVSDPPAGEIRRINHPFTHTDREYWSAVYWGGWLVRDDDVLAASDVTIDATGKTLTRSSGTWPLLVAGDFVALSGAGGANNTGTKTVVSRTDSVLTVSEDLTDESPTGLNVVVRNLPMPIERATIACARELLRKGGSERKLVSERFGPVTRTFEGGGRSDAQLPSAEAERLVRSYMRPL